MTAKIFFALSLSLISLLLSNSAIFASTLGLSPSGGNITKGSTLSVRVMLNTAGEGVNAVTAILSYPQDKLEPTAVGYGGSAFSIAAEEAKGGGSIKISRGSVEGANGNVNVATLTFKGKELGSASVNFVAGSAAPRTSDSSDSLNLGGSKGGTYNVVEASAKSEGSTKPSEEASKDTTPPKISEVTVASITKTSAQINWRTDEKSDSVVEYGLEKNQYFLNVSKPDLVTEHNLLVESPLLVPGTKIHYRVKSKDALGNQAGGEDSLIQLKGFKVTIKVVDEKNKPVSKTAVWLYSQRLESVTDGKGVVNFEDVSPGKHLVVVKLPGFEKTSEVEVTDSSEAQNFEINVATQATKKLTSNLGNIIYLVIAALIVILGSVALVLKIKKNTP